MPRKRKKKVDYAALISPFARIPGMDLGAARDLLDVGLKEVDELRGRAPEVLFAEVLKLRPETPQNHLWAIRLAVYYAETPEPDSNLLSPWAWQD